MTALLLCVLMAFGLAQQGAWQGKVLTKEGAKVIVNPSRPIYGHIQLDMEEEFKIGGNNNKKSLSYRVTDIAVDAQGNIYVVDMGNYRIQESDSAGKYLQTIGRVDQDIGIEYIRRFRIRNNENLPKVR